MVIVPLNELYIKSDEDSKKSLLESFSFFQCSRKSSDVEKFLKEQCINFEDKNLSRTYIVFDDETFIILGYFSIALKSIEISSLSNRIRKLFAGKSTLKTSPVFLIGQLAKEKSTFDKLKKYELLNTSLSYIKKAQLLVGGRAAYLDCSDDLVQYYERAGFVRLRKNEDGLNQMFISL